MVARILKSNRSCRGALDYSEHKAFMAVAELVSYANLPNDRIRTIYKTFERYESNPAIWRKNQKLSFHMAVNPDPDDEIFGNERRILQYIDTIMSELGYGAQPYVVYRHNDIDRVHYHVVSVRVDEKGKAIDSSYEGMHLLKLNRKLSKLFGFYVGDEGKDIDKSIKFEPAPIHITDDHRAERILADIEDALKYDFTTQAQFKLLLQQMNIGVKFMDSKTKKDSKNMWIALLNEKKRVSSMGFYAESRLKIHAYQKMKARIETNKKTPKNLRLILRTEAAVDYAKDTAKSWSEFEQMLTDCKLVFVPERKNGVLISYTVIDPLYHVLRSSVQMPGFIAPEILQSKGWEQGESTGKKILQEKDFEKIRERVVEMSNGKLKLREANAVKLK